MKVLKTKEVDVTKVLVVEVGVLEPDEVEAELLYEDCRKLAPKLVKAISAASLNVGMMIQVRVNHLVLEEEDELTQLVTTNANRWSEANTEHAANGKAFRDVVTKVLCEHESRGAPLSASEKLDNISRALAYCDRCGDGEAQFCDGCMEKERKAAMEHAARVLEKSAKKHLEQRETWYQQGEYSISDKHGYAKVVLRENAAKLRGRDE